MNAALLWIADHQPALIATTIVSAIALVVLIVGIAFTPRSSE